LLFYLLTFLKQDANWGNICLKRRADQVIVAYRFNLRRDFARIDWGAR